MLPQLQNDQSVDENPDDIDIENEEAAISRTFVPLLPPTN